MILKINNLANTINLIFSVKDYNLKHMKIEEPNSFTEFIELFDQYNSGGESYFRGQSNFDWKIVPSISRNSAHKTITNFAKLEISLYKKFKLTVMANKLQHLIPLVKNSYQSSWIYLMAAQHYGLPTRLLDFSFNKYSALEFAVTEIVNLNKDGAFIIYNNPHKILRDVDSEVLKRQFKGKNISFFFQAPRFSKATEIEFDLSEKRKIIQGSKFLYIDTHSLFKCLSTNQTHSDELVKIKISRSIKLKIINYLIKKGEIIYDQYSGKNLIDHCSAILKQDFYDIKNKTVTHYLKSSKKPIIFR